MFKHRLIRCKRIFIALVCMVFVADAFGQAGVLDPNDPIVNYNPGNPPPPVYGKISKWVCRVQLPWNASSYKSYNFDGLPFRLKFPKSYQHNVPDQKVYPVLLLLHGLGGADIVYDNERSLYNGGKEFRDMVDNGQFDGFILVPQSFSGYWESLVTPIRKVLDSMAKYVKADLDRVVINGISSGGNGVWSFLGNEPRHLAGAIPMSAHNSNNSFIPKFIHIPIWVGQGGFDQSPSPGITENSINNIRLQGGNVQYLYYPTQGHSIWDSVWAEQEFIPFLNQAHKANPLVFFNKNEFCQGDQIQARLGLTAGFAAYEWRRNGVVIDTATHNEIITDQLGTYEARFKRNLNGAWSAWSPTPVVIAYQQRDTTPNIQKGQFVSTFLPTLAGDTTALLEIPLLFGQESYRWIRLPDSQVISNQRSILATPGTYLAYVKETLGCEENYPSLPYQVYAVSGVSQPDIPRNLTAVTLSQSSVQLDWTDDPFPAFNEEGFELYRKDPNSPYKLIAVLHRDTLSYIDSALSPNTTYKYKLRAFSLTNASLASNEVSVITQIDNRRPTVPVGLKIESSTRTSISLKWDPSTDNVGIYKYDIYINSVKSYSVDTTRFTIQDLSPGQVYNFQVRARDLAGNISSFSNQVTGAAILTGVNYKYYKGTFTQLPNFDSLTPSRTGRSEKVDLSQKTRDYDYAFLFDGYLDIPADGTYRFYLLSDEGSRLYWGKYHKDSIPLIDHDGLHTEQLDSAEITLTKGVYPFAVSYFERNGAEQLKFQWYCPEAGIKERVTIPKASYVDSILPIITDTLPYRPNGLKAIAIEYNKVKLNWNDRTNNETGYELHRALSLDGTFRNVGTTGPNATEYVDTTVSAATTYYYKVRAIGKAGESQFGAIIRNVTTPPAPPRPPVPRQLHLNVLSSKSIGLGWKDTSSLTHSFDISRSVATNTKFRVIATISKNMADSNQAFIDTSLFANVRYYYRVRAVGTGGASSYSAILSDTTGNTVPHFFPQPEDIYVVTVNDSLDISIQAIDEDQDMISFQVQGLPSFCSTPVNGNGSLVIRCHPQITDTANHPVRVIVTDVRGGKDTAEFNLRVTTNNLPEIQELRSISQVQEGRSDSLVLWMEDVDPDATLQYAVLNLPGFAAYYQIGDSIVITVHPLYNDAGEYSFTLKVWDELGDTTKKTYSLKVLDKDPNRRFLVNIRSTSSPAPSPWNNMSGPQPLNLLTQSGETSQVTLSVLNGTWASSNFGPQTGNNSGYYPDVVLKDYLYFGIFGQPDQVNLRVSNLDTSLTYQFRLIAASSWSGTPDNGTTVYTIGDSVQSIYVQNNTDQTAYFPNVKPDNLGNVTINMGKSPGTPVGYLNALEIQEIYRDGTAPISPFGLSAIQEGFEGIRLNWVDRSYNESGFEILRRIGDTGQFILLNPSLGNFNSNTYLDTQVVEATHYYYTIRAVNSFGSSSFSDTVDLVTGNTAPVLSNLQNLVIRAGDSARIGFAFFDDPQDTVTISYEGLPGFATTSLHAPDSGYIHFNPGPTVKGIFRNIKVIATDRFGATVSRIMAVYITDQEVDEIYVNMGSSGISADYPWNNFTGSPSAGKNLNNLQTSLGSPSGISIHLMSNWSGISSNGMVTGLDDGVVSDKVLQSSFLLSDTVSRTIEIRGLDTSSRYNIGILGSNNGGKLARGIVSTSTGQKDFDARYNDRRITYLTGLRPDNSGKLSFTLKKWAADEFTYLNGCIIEKYNDSNAFIKPGILFGEPLSERSIQLRWSDRSDKETGYEIWRSTDGTNFSLVSLAGANETEMIDSSLVPNKTYFYKIRGVGDHGLYSLFTEPVRVITPASTVSIHFTLRYPAPFPWNNTNALPYVGLQFDNLINGEGTNSGVGIQIIENFHGEFFEGVNTNNNSGIFPDNVLIGSYWIENPEKSKIRISNLDQSKKYRIGLFASSDWESNFTANYRIGERSRYLNAYKNSSRAVWLDGCTPNSDGEIDLDILAVTGSRFAFLGALIIQRYNEYDSLQAANTPTAFRAITPSVSGRTQQELSGLDAPAPVSELKVGVYPNPFDDWFNLRVQSPVEWSAMQLTLSDLQGKTIWNQRLGGNNSMNANILVEGKGAGLWSGKTYVLTVRLETRQGPVIRSLLVTSR